MSSRWLLVALLVLVTSPLSAAELPNVEEVRASARKAVGFDAFQKLPAGIVYEGRASVLGIPGTFRSRISPDGRYVRVIEARGAHVVGFDGKTRWGRNFSSPVLVFELDEADRDRFLFAVLCQQWLADDAGYVARVDPKNTSDARVCLTLTHRSSDTIARLHLDRTTWRPDRLEVPGAAGTRVVEFSDYRELAGVRFPATVVIGPKAGGVWITGERGRPASSGDDPAFAVPVVGSTVSFDPAAPAKLEARRMGDGQLLLVRPKVNGEVGPWFVIDTGNGALTMMTAAAADRSGMTTFGGVEMIGVSTVKTRFRQSKTFTLGPATIADMVLAEMPQDFADAMSEKAGVKVSGYIGWDVMLRVVLELDHRAATVAVHDPANYRLPANVCWEPVHLNARTPCVRGTFEGKHEGLFLLDTGHEPSLTLHAPAVKRLDLLKDRETAPRTISGFGGTTRVRGGSATELHVLGRTIKPVDANFATEQSGLSDDPYTLGTIGLTALGPGVVVFDYPNRRIAFIAKP